MDASAVNKETLYTLIMNNRTSLLRNDYDTITPGMA